MSARSATLSQRARWRRSRRPLSFGGVCAALDVESAGAIYTTRPPYGWSSIVGEAAKETISVVVTRASTADERSSISRALSTKNSPRSRGERRHLDAASRCPRRAQRRSPRSSRRSSTSFATGALGSVAERGRHHPSTSEQSINNAKLRASATAGVWCGSSGETLLPKRRMAGRSRAKVNVPCWSISWLRPERCRTRDGRGRSPRSRA